jgi:hypothetical protein
MAREIARLVLLAAVFVAITVANGLYYERAVRGERSVPLPSGVVNPHTTYENATQAIKRQQIIFWTIEGCAFAACIGIIALRNRAPS